MDEQQSVNDAIQRALFCCLRDSINLLYSTISPSQSTDKMLNAR